LTGIGRVKALQLVTVMEIVRRGQARGASPEDEMLNRPDLIHTHFKPQIAGLAVEKFWVLCLNRKNRLLKQAEITSGTATSSLAHPREVFREAIRHGATAIICVHNHPSGDPAPSAADVQVTRQMRDAAKAVDIELLDHVIVGREGADPQGRGYYSFREAGVI
ncbi:MAG: DNA repair protein RadC, partial [Lacunisphaera sp.]|nr:DNA repair protein RadC [Lacunisphaera sp.]